MTGNYDDIIHLPRPISRTRRPMPRQDRAAQFAPFSALTGLDGVLGEAEKEKLEKEMPQVDIIALRGWEMSDII